MAQSVVGYNFMHHEQPPQPIYDQPYEQLDSLTHRAAETIALGSVAYIASQNILQVVTPDGYNVALEWMQQHDPSLYDYIQQRTKWQRYRQLPG